MSAKSIMTNSIRSGTDSFKQNSMHEKLHITSSNEEKIMLAAEESKDRLYEPKRDKKMVRVVTVIVYVFCVSLAAIMLSLYYVFFWKPHYQVPHATTNTSITTTTPLPRCLPLSEPSSIAVTDNIFASVTKNTTSFIDIVNSTVSTASDEESNYTQPLDDFNNEILYAESVPAGNTKFNLRKKRRRNDPE